VNAHRLDDGLDSLEALETTLWDQLVLAAATRGHPWRTPVLATADGDRPDARTMVLREVDRGARRLRFFTDARAPKAGQLQRQPEGVLVMWSEALSWQLRLRVAIELHVDGLTVSSRWARLKMTPAAQDYLSPLPPGTALPHPALPERASRAHFALGEARVLLMDWLELRAGGHRRAVFDADGARWVQP
jgi:hypothetical protein